MIARPTALQCPAAVLAHNWRDTEAVTDGMCATVAVTLGLTTAADGA
jgi:hypothetical protein